MDSLAPACQNVRLSQTGSATPLDELERQANINFSTEKYLLQLQPGVAKQIVAGAKDMKHDFHTMNHPSHMHSPHFQVTQRAHEADSENVLFRMGAAKASVCIAR